MLCSTQRLILLQWDIQSYALATVRCPAPSLVDLDPLIQRYACGALLPRGGITNPAQISTIAKDWCAAKNTTNSQCAIIGSYYWNRCTNTGLTVNIGGVPTPVYARSFCSFGTPSVPSSAY